MDPIMRMFKIFELKEHKQFEYDFIKYLVDDKITDAIKNQSQNIDTILVTLFTTNGIIKKNKYDINVDDTYKLVDSVYQHICFKESFDFISNYVIDNSLENHELELFEILRREKQRIIELFQL